MVSVCFESRKSETIKGREPSFQSPPASQIEAYIKLVAVRCQLFATANGEDTLVPFAYSGFMSLSSRTRGQPQTKRKAVIDERLSTKDSN